MGRFDKKIARRDFLKGAGAAAVGVAAVGMFGGAALAAEDADAVTGATTVASAQEAAAPVQSGSGTKYTTYANADEIGIIHDAAFTANVDAVVVGTASTLAA